MTEPTKPARRRRRTLPDTWWGIVLFIAVPVVALAAAAITVLLLTVKPADAKDRIELIKAGLGVGAGAAGVIALVLAGRRQWATEDANRVTEHDATEKRATELYVKAAEQLGADQVPIRLAGLFALERLGDAHPELRQTVADLLCAYLRMPFDQQQSEPLQRDTVPHQAAAADDHERQVRLTVQNILHAHLSTRTGPRAPGKRNWGPLSLDLEGATLINFNLGQCSVGAVSFAGATFLGSTYFNFTTFTGGAFFYRATFTAGVSFYSATFDDVASFGGTSFSGTVHFSEATFRSIANFDEAIFRSSVLFQVARFATDIDYRFPGVYFQKASFAKRLDLDRAIAAAPIIFTKAEIPELRLDYSALHGLIGLARPEDPSRFSAAHATNHGRTMLLEEQFDLPWSIAPHLEDEQEPTGKRGRRNGAPAGHPAGGHVVAGQSAGLPRWPPTQLVHLMATSRRESKPPNRV